MGKRVYKYMAFTRAWWIIDENGEKIPCSDAPRKVRGTFKTETEARAFCHKWNEEHEAGELSVKCEFMER